MKHDSSTAFIGSGSEMQALGRDFDWSTTPLGAIESWPASLRAIVSLVLNSRQPMFLFWGPQLTQIYNDGYRPSFGNGKHPGALGQRAQDCWKEVWDVIGPILDEVRSGGSTALHEDQLLPVRRNERIEDVYWTYTYNPVFDELNQVAGVLTIVNETTTKVVSARRQVTHGWLARRLRTCQSRQEVCDALQEAVYADRVDLPAVYFDRSGERVEPAEVRIEARSVGVDVNMSLTFLLNPRVPYDDAYRQFLDNICIAAAAVMLEIEAVQSNELTTAARNQLLTDAPVATAVLTGSYLVFQLANPSYLALAGRQSIEGRRFDDVFPELIGSAIREIFQNALNSGSPYNDTEIRIELEIDGALEERYSNFNLTPLRNPAGETYGLMVMVLDVTSQVQARKRAEMLNDELQTAMRIKDEFLAMLGHELRNPLAPIVSALEVLDGRSSELTVAHRLIKRHVEHLQRLVDDLLDISRITKGMVDLRKEHVDIVELVETAAAMTEALFQRSDHPLTVDVPSIEVFCEPARIVQVLCNLLTNAARYTGPGGDIRIDAASSDGELKLVVSDNGIGISAALLPNVFDLFTQGKRRADRSEGGLGLGLSLVRNLVELHGGHVTGESGGKHCGSSFTVTIPLGDAQADSTVPMLPGDPELDNLNDARVLLVDDNADAVDMLAELLSMKGFQVDVAYEPGQTISLFGQRSFEFAVLDIGLPDMDGYELLTRRQTMPGNSDCRFISLSGYGQTRDRLKSLATGFVKHLVKPAAIDDLLRLLRNGERT